MPRLFYRRRILFPPPPPPPLLSLFSRPVRRMKTSAGVRQVFLQPRVRVTFTESYYESLQLRDAPTCVESCASSRVPPPGFSCISARSTRVAFLLDPISIWFWFCHELWQVSRSNRLLFLSTGIDTLVEREREGEGENLDKFRIYIWRIFYGEWRED